MGAVRQDTRTLLVTGAAGPAGRALGRQLLARGPDDPLGVVGVDAVPASVPGFAAVESAPWATDASYDRLMLELLARVEPDLVIPTVSEELPRLAVLAEAAGLTGRVVVSPPGPAAVAGDKLLTMWALARQDVAVPRHAPADAFASTATVLRHFDGPVVVKPRVSRGGRGVHVVQDADAKHWADFDGSWVVQAFAPGREYSPQVYRSPVTGECVVVVLEKTELEDGLVGNATAVRRVSDGGAQDVADLAVRCAQALGLVGPLDMDVRRLDDGTPVVLEVNARFGAVSAEAPEIFEALLGDWPG